jgi:MOSC domain-containing protein
MAKVSPRIAWISIAPVKGLALVPLEEAHLGPEGVAGDRAFHLVDREGKLVNGKRLGRLMLVRPEVSGDRLALRFPDDIVVDGELELGDSVVTNFYGRPVEGRIVRGPWDAALSDYARTTLRLVRVTEPGDGHDRGAQAGATIIGSASLEALGAAAGLDRRPDGRRFRMLLGVDGTAPHEEDGWLGCRVRVGEAGVLLRGNVGRCAVTTYDPDTAERDLETLDVIGRYRADVLTTEPLPFGVWGEVVEPGRVAVGDPVETQG